MYALHYAWKRCLGRRAQAVRLMAGEFHGGRWIKVSLGVACHTERWPLLSTFVMKFWKLTLCRTACGAMLSLIRSWMPHPSREYNGGVTRWQVLLRVAASFCMWKASLVKPDVSHLFWVFRTQCCSCTGLRSWTTNV
jgi:hypothetical protein